MAQVYNYVIFRSKIGITPILGYGNPVIQETV